MGMKTNRNQMSFNFFVMRKKKEVNPQDQRKSVEHRGNDEELKKNFEEEMKLAQKSEKSYYTREGGIKKKYM